MSDKLHILDEPEPSPKKTASTTSKPEKYHWKGLELLISSTSLMVPIILYVNRYTGAQAIGLMLLIWCIVMLLVPFCISLFSMLMQTEETYSKEVKKQEWQLVWKRFYIIQKGLFLIMLFSFLLVLCLFYWTS